MTAWVVDAEQIVHHMHCPEIGEWPLPYQCRSQINGTLMGMHEWLRRRDTDRGHRGATMLRPCSHCLPP